MIKLFKIIILLNIFLLGQSPQEIKQAKEFIQRTGISKTQARILAKQKGFTEEQINDAIKKEKKMEPDFMEIVEDIDLPVLGESNDISHENPILENDLKNFTIKSLDTVEKLDTFNEETRMQLDYFGYDIFSRDPALFQETSIGVVDPDYLIGPGDEIIIMLWGETQFRQVFMVDREGFVFIPEIGQVFVNGLNLSLLESKLFRVFSQSYASLNPQGRAPTTFLDISLGNLRPLRIQVLGDVSQPGAYTVSPSTTLFSSLYYFNGPTNLGSLRDIQLIRDGEKIVSIDFYDYLLTGKKHLDQKLQLDDVVFIPRRLKTVSIEGKINRNGIYELKPEEHLKDLISIAGDLNVAAYIGRSQIDRILPFKDREKFKKERIYIDVSLESILNSENSFELQDGDRIKIFSVDDEHENIITIQGAITRGGTYELGDSLRLSELINKADGIMGDAYLERVDIIRTKKDLSKELIRLNLGKALSKDPDNDIFLQDLDRIRIYSMLEMIPDFFVSIEGHVKRPGKYKLQKNMRLYDLIFKAGGGVVDKEFRKRTYLGRGDLLRLDEDRINRTIVKFNLGEIIESPSADANILLKPGDIVRLYQKDIFIPENFVTINGFVKKPGTYPLKTKMTLKDLILEAGGIKENIYRYRVELARVDLFNQNIDEYADVILFDMDKTFNLLNEEIDFDSTNLITLRPHDLVSIRSDPFFSNQKQVTLSGEILYPGKYTILKSDEKITDLIKRGGGLRSNGYLKASQYFRNGRLINASFEKIMKNPKSKLNFIVQEGDEIIINPYPNIITLTGEVNAPGIHKYVPGKRLRYYLRLAGGLTSDADKSNIYIMYPSNDSKKHKRFSLFSAKVPDGSNIVIKKLKPREPFDQTEFAKEMTAILANLAQAIAVITLAGR